MTVKGRDRSLLELHANSSSAASVPAALLAVRHLVRPDGVPGFAIPFYLAHPRLKRLEKTHMLEIEGANKTACLRLMRHETAHTLANAYRLHLRQAWRRRFGRASRSYPDSYLPRPGSRNYVLHLDGWYAQSHPAEDWAETFAVWLDPASHWQKRYRDWPALKKLGYVEGLVQELAVRSAPVKTRKQIDALPTSGHPARIWRKAGALAAGFSVFPRLYCVVLGQGRSQRKRRALLAAYGRPSTSARWTPDARYRIDLTPTHDKRCDE